MPFDYTRKNAERVSLLAMAMDAGVVPEPSPLLPPTTNQLHSRPPPTTLTPVLESPSSGSTQPNGSIGEATGDNTKVNGSRSRYKSEPVVSSGAPQPKEEHQGKKVERSNSKSGNKKYPKQGSKELLLEDRITTPDIKKSRSRPRRGSSKMGGMDGVEGTQTFPKRTRKESMLGPVGRMIPPLRKQSTIMESLPRLDVQVLESLMYQYDPKNRTDDGIMRLCKEVKDKWGGSMIPSTQYGLNDAWNKMNQAENMKVEFAIRSNVTFNGFHDDDSPIHGKAVTFRTRDCLHIKAQFNEDWWIGRVVKCDAPMGFVPTPMKLKKLVQELANQQLANKDANSLSHTNRKKTHSVEAKEKKTASIQDIPSKDSNENIAIAQTRVSEVDQKAQGPYEAIPLIRPIILCGPSNRGFDVTDLMHKALFHAIKREFGDKLDVVTVEEKYQKSLGNKGTALCSESMENVMNKIFAASQSFRLLFFDLQANINPTFLKRSPLAPILVHIKISNMKILQNLIKQRGGEQKRSCAAQVYAATKLCDLDKRVFDVVLKEHNFEDAAEHLITYLAKYYDASRPTQAPKRTDQFLRSTLNPGFMGVLAKTPKLARSPFGSRRNNSKKDSKADGLKQDI